MENSDAFLIDPKNPSQTKNYKKLRRILKGDFLVILDPLVYAYPFEKQIFDKDLLEDLELPDGFSELSPPKKAEIFVKQFSTNDWLDLIDSIVENDFKSLPLWLKFFLGGSASNNDVLSLSVASSQNSLREVDLIYVLSEQNKDWINEDFERIKNTTNWMNDFGKTKSADIFLPVVLIAGNWSSFPISRFTFHKSSV